MRQYSDYEHQATLILIAFVLLIVVLWAAWSLLVGWRQRLRRDELLRQGRLEPFEVPRIQPPRMPDVTARVRYEPDPMDYRKAHKIIEGVSEDPFDHVDADAGGPRRGHH